MTELRPAPRQTPRHLAPRHLAWLPILLAAGLLQACADNRPNVATSVRRIFAIDVAGGAKLCQAPKLTPADGQTTEAVMGVGNDGGWCGITAQMPGGKPFGAGLLSKRPAHGNVLIHEVGDFTRIDYTPDRGFSGDDSFAVKLVPGGATIHVTVSVAGPGAALKS